MNNLFYELIYDKKAKRMMKILSEIDNGGGHKTYNDLSSALHITRKTLNTDLLYLQETLPKDFKLIINEHEASIISNEAKSIQDYILESAMQSAIYQIMERVLYNIPTNIHDLAEELFISESSIRKRIVYYNKILKRFRVELTSYNIQMIGDEISIRYFLHAFYTEFRQLVVLSPETRAPLNLDMYARLRNSMLEHGYPIINTSYFKAEHWFVLAEARIHIGAFAEIRDEKLKNIVLASKRYVEFKEVYLQVSKQMLINISLPEDEIIWAFVTILDTVIYASKDKRFGMFRSDIIYNDKTAVLHNIINEVATEVGLSGDGDLTNVLFAYFRNLTQLTALSPVYQVSSTAIINIARRDISHIYELWIRILTEMKNFLTFNLYYLEDICANLTFITYQYSRHVEHNVRRILCSFSGESGLSSYLGGKLKDVIGCDIEIIFISNEEITAELTKRERIDLIVCNYVISDSNITVPIFRIPYVPFKKDWKALCVFINEL